MTMISPRMQATLISRAMRIKRSRTQEDLLCAVADYTEFTSYGKIVREKGLKSESLSAITSLYLSYSRDCIRHAPIDHTNSFMNST
jgi:hypothetical protein